MSVLVTTVSSTTPTLDQPAEHDQKRDLIEQAHASLGSRRTDLLKEREVREKALSSGTIGPLPATAVVRSSDWSIRPLPERLMERRVELLGDASRKGIIEGMNTGAKTYIADLWNMTAQREDELFQAHRNLKRASRGTLTYTHPEEGRMRLSPNREVRLCVVPRPLDQLSTVPRSGISASLFDIVKHCENNADALIERQAAVLFMLRDVRSHLEARWYASLFDLIEEALMLPRGSIRATVMIDHVSAALELHEILFELQHHSFGLALDPQAYALSHVNIFGGVDKPVMPDRERIGLDAPFLRALSLSIIGTCHKRGAHAMGAPSFVQPPNPMGVKYPGYEEMLSDMAREAKDGHDGTIVGDHGIVNAAMIEFNKYMGRNHQIHYLREDVIDPKELIELPAGELTVESLVNLIRTVLLFRLSERQGNAWTALAGRVHDRSSMALAMALLEQWTMAKAGKISRTELEINVDLLSYLVKKEADKILVRKGEGVRAELSEITAELLAHLDPSKVGSGAA